MLNLDSAATDQELKLAYRKAVIQWHPDRYQQATDETRKKAEQQMQALNTAYSTLSKYYETHGYMPGHIAPDYETPPEAEQWQSTTVEDSEISQQSDWQSSAQTTPSTKEKQQTSLSQGRVWFAAFAVLLVVAYLYSKLPEESPYSTIEVIEQKSANESTADKPISSQTHQKEKTTAAQGRDATELQVETSPFSTKERKSAFEQTSPLGIYEESSADKYFTYGDTAGRVFEIQGVPTRTVGDIWYYGESEVHFQDGRVKGWFVSDGDRLKAWRKQK